MISSDLLLRLGVLLTAVFLYRIKKMKYFQLAALPLPPGPKKLPLLGNVLQLPRTYGWKTYHQWCIEYDTDVLHLDLAGTSVIIVDSLEAARALLEKRSALYSDRPGSVMIRELMGWSFLTGFLPYGNEWRRHRRLAHQMLHDASLPSIQKHMTRATQNCLLRLLEDPDGFRDHLLLMGGTTIIGIAYGLETSVQDDPYIRAAEESLKPLFIASVPGTFLVDQLPLLKYVPAWMPGAGFKRKAREWYEMSQTTLHHAYTDAKRAIDSGSYVPSFLSESLQKLQGTTSCDFDEADIRNLAGTMFSGVLVVLYDRNRTHHYEAGVDTTFSTIMVCLMGLLSNPDAVKKAQAELDAIIGTDRLPELADQSSLPYTVAIVKEGLRWKPVVPISIPHAIMTDDIYRNWRIPGNSIVIPNVWAILRNEKDYPDPSAFKPDRYLDQSGALDPTVLDPAVAAFGFGRRICPGRHLAYSGAWLTIASILSTFEITKARDEKGEVIEPAYEMNSALTCTPLPFKCTLKPRSKEAEKVIRGSISHKN